MYVKEAYVGKSIVMKRFRPRAKGRASAIKKPFSRITIILEEKKKEEKIMGQKLIQLVLDLALIDHGTLFGLLKKVIMENI